MAWAGPLVDTSVLIDYFGGIDSRESQIDVKRSAR